MNIDIAAGIVIALILLMFVGMFVGIIIFAYKVGKEDDEFWADYYADRDSMYPHNKISRRNKK